MAHIVLVHGIFGAGNVQPAPFLPSVESPYFNGLRRHFEFLGHAVLPPSVPPLGDVETRAQRLAAHLEREWPARDDLVLIGHSMGGLDIRRLLASGALAPGRVRAVVTIATPLLGSPVADAFLHSLGPLRLLTPPWLAHALRPHAGALPDLATRAAPLDDDVDGVRYLEVACDGRDAGLSLFSGLRVALTAVTGEPNDGLVTLKSATSPQRPLAEVWPVDHGGAIGWPTGGFGWDGLMARRRPPPDHLQRYGALLARALR